MSHSWILIFIFDVFSAAAGVIEEIALKQQTFYLGIVQCLFVVLLL